MGPAASLEGRVIGRDFAGVDGWNMYHGEAVPGFPRHPHRGFETVTVVRKGRLDHADSMGATARYGDGDVQWLTAGGGIQHAEMFPLMNTDAENPAELFQIWLNLPAADKMVPSHFKMLWHEDIPVVTSTDADGRETEVTVVAGSFGDQSPPSPPPNSWASKARSDLAIWKIRMDAGARLEMPTVSEGTDRSVYVHVGAGARVGGADVDNQTRVELEGAGPIELLAGSEDVEILLLQGRAIGEPVARRGPFVMNTQAEIRQAYTDYQATAFGGWPWPNNAPVHARAQGRFALRADGVREEPG
jgi:redox-sensitive bicupin YhaK (pirin superfamily)